MSGSLVGRDRELDLVAGLLAASGPAVVTVTGEPGIGKSRLLSAFARLAATTGAATATGRATEFEADVPLAAWHDVAAGLPPVRAALDREPGGLERHRRHHAVRAALGAAAAGRGLLVQLDDVHWADEASIELTDFLVRHPPEAGVVLVIAARAGRLPHRLERSLGPGNRLELAPIGADDAGAWLGGADPARRDRLYAASGGIPLLLDILAALPATTDLDELLSGGAELPVGRAGLDRLITAELAGLPRPLRQVAQAVAVAGDGADPALVAAVADRPGVPAADLDELVTRDVLRPAGRGLRFRHPLLRAAAYRSAGPMWRAGAHQRAADHLRAADAPPAARAAHREHALRAGDLTDVRELAEAGEQAMAAAPRTAVRWLRTALDAFPDRPDLGDERDDGRLALARALVADGRPDESRSLLHELLLTAGPRRRADAVRLLAVTERNLGDLDRAYALVAAEVTRDRTPDRAALLADLAETALYQGKLTECREFATDALNRAGGRPGLTAVATTLLAVAALYACDFPDGLRLLADAGRRVDALGDPELGDDLAAVVPLAWGEFLVDRHADATRHLDRGLRVARRYGRPQTIPMNYAVRAAIRLRAGQVAAAVEDAEGALAVSRQVGGPDMRAFVGIVLARPTLWRAGPAPVLATVDAAVSAPPLRSLWWRTMADHSLAEILLSVGDARRCRDLLRDRVPADPYGLGPNAISTFAMRAQAEATLGDQQAAARWHARAAALAATGAPAAQSGCVARAGAVLALARGDRAAAVRDATEAVERFRAGAIPIGEGLARLVLADAAEAAGDGGAARRTRGSARELFESCDAPWLAALVGRQQRQAGARQRRRPGASDALSGREREIAELVAQGLTNRQVAERLYLSPRTVETHLARVFQKLRVTTRTALARWVSDAA